MTDKNWKTKTILIGVVIGALAGAASGYILVKRAESENTQPKMSPGDGVQVGISLLGILRLISGIGSN